MSMDNDNLIICRCEEITLGEIKAAIRDGARSVTGVKRRTRAGMGLCQGRTCETLIQRIMAAELETGMKAIPPGTDRPPSRPITLGVLGGEKDE